MDKNKQLLNKAKLLIAIGTQVKPNVELDRLTSKALDDLTIAVINLEHNLDEPFVMSDEEIARVLTLSKMYCINTIMVSQEGISK